MHMLILDVSVPSDVCTEHLRLAKQVSLGQLTAKQAHRIGRTLGLHPKKNGVKIDFVLKLSIKGVNWDKVCDRNTRPALPSYPL